MAPTPPRTPQTPRRHQPNKYGAFYTPRTRMRCVLLHEDGKSFGSISKETGVPKSSVRNIVKQQQLRPPTTNGKLLWPKNPGGRPCKLSEEEKEFIVALATANKTQCFKTNGEITVEANVHLRNPVSKETIRRVLLSANIVQRVPRQAPHVSLIKKQDRVNFINWLFSQPDPIALLRAIAWTDESSFHVGQFRGRRLVRRKRGKFAAYTRNVMLRKRNKGTTASSIWGLILYGRRGHELPMVIFKPETKDDIERSKAQLELEAQVTGTPVKKRTKRGLSSTDWYMHREQILRPVLFPYIHFVQDYYNEIVVVMEDNAPWHTKDYLAEEWQRAHLIRIEWPSNSPDLNPIENIWLLMKERLNKIIPPYLQTKKNVNELIPILWAELTEDDINGAIMKTLERARTVLELEGDNCYFQG